MEDGHAEGGWGGGDREGDNGRGKIGRGQWGEGAGQRGAGQQGGGDGEGEMERVPTGRGSKNSIVVACLNRGAFFLMRDFTNEYDGMPRWT